MNKAIIIIINLILNILSQRIVANITLKIKGYGFKNVFSSNNNFPVNSYPNKIYINIKEKNSINPSYYLINETNYIKLLWNHRIKNCQAMFYGCSDIIEIDLSNFDSSDCESLGQMFENCISLISLNLSNFNTSKITYSATMFKNCISLVSLDLSSFKTSKITDFGGMFENCTSLTSLNLSNFDFSKAYIVWDMFSLSKNLEYINIKNFHQ